MPGQSDAPDGYTLNRPTLGIVGVGRVGGALARALHQRHWPISVLCSRSTVAVSNLSEITGARNAESIDEVARHAELVVLAVPDSAIQAVCEQLATSDLTGHAVVHTSGVTPVAALKSASAHGAQIGGLHPVWPIARGDRPLPPGGWFGIEADERPLRDWLSDLVAALGGSVFWLPPDVDRIRYHAAPVLLSNYLVTLYVEAAAVWHGIGIEPEAARAALLGLARAALDNLANLEPGDPALALTGPIVRGDAATVRAHLSALHDDPELAAAYRILGRLTLRLAARRGLSIDRWEALYRALAETNDEMNDANYNLRFSKDEARRAENPDGDSL